MYMKKFLNRLEFDWLRAVQLQGNTVLKKGDTQICTELPFIGYCTSLENIFFFALALKMTSINQNIVPVTKQNVPVT